MAWEYKIVGLSTASAEAHLNRLGVDGWELVCFDHGQAYLKRPVLTTTEVVKSSQTPTRIKK